MLGMGAKHRDWGDYTRWSTATSTLMFFLLAPNFNGTPIPNAEKMAKA
jgi:hypothetical protein